MVKKIKLVYLINNLKKKFFLDIQYLNYNSRSPILPLQPTLINSNGFSYFCHQIKTINILRSFIRINLLYKERKKEMS